MSILTNINFRSISFVLLAILISFAASINTFILVFAIIIFSFVILTLRKKVIQTFFLLPFLLFSFVPSTFVVSLNINSPIGSLRPSIISIGLFIIILISHKLFKVDLSLVHKNSSLLGSIILFFFLNLISIILTGFNFYQFRIIFFVFILSFFVLLFVLATNHSINVLRMIKISMVASTFVATLGIIEFFGIQPYLKLYLLNRDWFYYNNLVMDGLPRVVSSMGNPLILAGYLLLCFPIVLLMRDVAINKLFWNISALIHALCIMFTQSRSAILILTIITFLYLFKTVKINKLIKNLLFILISGGLFYFILNAFGLIQSFYDRILFRSDPESYTVRAHSFNTIVDILNNTNPLFGLGSNPIDKYVENTGILVSTTLDNTFLTVLANFGMLGLLSFFLIILALLKCFSRLGNSFKFTGNLLIIIFIGLGFSYNTTVYESVWGVLWFLTGLLLLLDRQYSENLFPPKVPDNSLLNNSVRPVV